MKGHIQQAWPTFPDHFFLLTVVVVEGILSGFRAPSAWPTFPDNFILCDPFLLRLHNKSMSCHRATYRSSLQRLQLPVPFALLRLWLFIIIIIINTIITDIQVCTILHCYTQPCIDRSLIVIIPLDVVHVLVHVIHMYVCMCVCMYVCVHVCMYVCIYNIYLCFNVMH